MESTGNGLLSRSKGEARAARAQFHQTGSLARAALPSVVLQNFTVKENEKSSSPTTPATLQVLSSYMWFVATILESAGRVHPCRKLLDGTALDCIGARVPLWFPELIECGSYKLIGQ